MVQETTVLHPFSKYLREEMMPHIWCPGCGNGIVLNCFTHALDELKTDLDKLVIVSGIGCIGRTAGYINTDSFHTTHGRALAFATGVKLANPDLEIVVISGDGDLFAIGGNHFIHAARRNVDIAVICSNNFNYGMTGGQSGPTTPFGAYTTTTLYGNIEHPLNLVQFAAACGAVYVARWTAIHVRRIRESMKKAINKKGFSFVEIITACPEEYGRRNKIPDPIQNMKWLRDASIVESSMDPKDAVIEPDKIVVGEFVDVEKPEYTDLLWGKAQSIQIQLDKEAKLSNVTL